MELNPSGRRRPAAPLSRGRRRAVAASLSVAASLGVGAAISSRPTAAADTPAALPPVTVGRTTVAWTPANGFSLAVDGVAVVRKSTLYVVKEGWNGLLLDQTTPPVVSPWKDADDGAKTATVTLENADAACAYTFTVTPRDTVTVDLAYRMKRDVPAEIEYAAGYLSAPVFAGGTVGGGNGPKRFAPSPISLAPPAPGRPQEENRLAPPFKTLSFETRLGRIGVFYTGGAAEDPVIFDARGDDQAWATEFPVFWMGLGSPARKFGLKDGTRHATFTYTVGAAPASATAAPSLATFAAGARGLSDAYRPVPSATPLVIPRPKEMTTAGAPFRLTKRTSLVVAPNAAPEAKRAAELIRREVKARFGTDLPVLTAPLPYDASQSALSVALVDASGGGEAPSVESIPAPPAKPEGYAVAVEPQRVLFAGKDGAGVFWGAQTLVQLLAADDQGAFVRAVRVTDWPSLALRSVHLFHGQNALPFHEKLIDRIYSRFKMNALFIQAEQVRWDHDPAVAPNWAGTKAALAEEIKYAKERGITMYPLVQSYGHMEWLFNKGDNKKYAEDPETPYAVNFTDPAAVKYLEGFNAEADDLFGAPAFHIGLDEVTMRGRFPFRSAPKTFPELYVTAVTHWNDFFKKRGKPVYMWADMALHPSEVRPDFGTAPSAADAKAVREGLPKDIIMVDWQYGGRDEFPSLKLLKDAGFSKVVAATWFNPDNIRGFAKAAAKVGAYGAMQTTWAGYESNETVLDGEQRKQFEAMVLAAEYFWNGGDGPAPNELPYRAPEVFAQQWAGPDPAASHVRQGVAFDLSAAGNAPLPNWLGYGPASGPRDLPAGKRVRLSDGVTYDIPAKAVLLDGRLNAPGTPAPKSVTVTLPAGRPVSELRLLVAASHPSERGRKIGTVTLTRKDGTAETVDLVYGKNVAALEDAAAMPAAPAVWTGELGTGQPAALRRLTLRPGKDGKPAEVASLTITSEGAGAAPALFGVTAITE
jgi:hypothetical protein